VGVFLGSGDIIAETADSELIILLALKLDTREALKTIIEQFL